MGLEALVIRLPDTAHAARGDRFDQLVPAPDDVARPCPLCHCGPRSARLYAREHKTHCTVPEAPALAELGFRDALDPVVVTGFTATRARKLTPGQKDANRVLALGRVQAEHGIAHLKNWRTLTKLRTDPARTTHLLRALLVLTNLEINRCQTIYSADNRPRPA
ncbi:transposase family protein [Streptomyces sp. NPDC059564]|uniref:transposase family protein n=1 Tax=Streptomyces sp. NPDC059564 TaxID=3346865 RepID=UPI0036881A84